MGEHTATPREEPLGLTIRLNGLVRDIPAGSNVEQLVLGMGYGHQALAVAVNRQVVLRRNWAQHDLQPGDEVEIVRPIGGG